MRPLSLTGHQRRRGRPCESNMVSTRFAHDTLRSELKLQMTPDRSADSPTSVSAPPKFNWLAVVFVWGIWALMATGAFALVWQRGDNIPYIDDWAFVSRIVTDQVDAGWL